MSTNAVRSFDTGVAAVDMKVEVIVIPVSDVDRAKEFYGRLGWRLDADFRFDNGFRVVQITPHGSGCSVQFGKGLTSAAPGSAKGYLIVSDIVGARDKLIDVGIDVSEIFHIGTAGPVSGPDPGHRSYYTRASFNDPDGNNWLLQEVTTRLPGRIDSGATTFGSVSDLASALRRAAAAHGEHEKRIGAADPNWPDWYAAYMVAEQAGTELPK
jgi:catechol 2,3-dioxygenase-like lactoylglutathione lyase family enzyme